MFRVFFLSQVCGSTMVDSQGVNSYTKVCCDIAKVVDMVDCIAEKCFTGLFLLAKAVAKFFFQVAALRERK